MIYNPSTVTLTSKEALSLESLVKKLSKHIRKHFNPVCFEVLGSWRYNRVVLAELNRLFYNEGWKLEVRTGTFYIKINYSRIQD